MSAHAELRAATASDHEAVDAAFERFDLGEPGSYADFLTAHARALPPVEAALAARGGPPVRPRAPLLYADLAALGRAPPPVLPVAAPRTEAEAFGMAYVIEGSRLGGSMLARRIGAGLPHAYLSAAHLPGEWRAFGQALDAAAAAGGDAWIAQCGAAARQVFALYARAARGG